MSEGKSNPDMQQMLQYAQAAFERMPTLGPVAWLFGRDEQKKHLTLADLDWAVQPALILDQCRLFMNDKMPFAYVSWALVSDEVHARLQQGQTRLAPHEWKGGGHVWLIDIVTPFGQGDSVIAELKQGILAGKIVHSSIDQKPNQY
ncbi:toxin-activating lysine-acyltransferase [Chitiniphilus purpureus]|uniref:RTX toxin-activating lysine-acyltransferase n=1 Tax=Chitiniphilus purpureus TaxID=2981137 RepID=A0ABY6DR55_9NEIS|nr:toxin-activating lysine-acyltransferase [Chitiniphilus sp. CD1]UXY16835.1 toxin-activating lysine-acyltransferase [Chitiniphilus sp. CD1]